MKKHLSLKIYGLVQGVGFRPFLHKAAQKFYLHGRVFNVNEGLSAELEGEEENIASFIYELKSSPPPLSSIIDIEYEYSDELAGYTDFCILESSVNNKDGYTFAGADTAPCEDCVRELFEPSDRRYKYAFINCTNCGPRYSILHSLPYDRHRTVMDRFHMCGHCRNEYDDVDDRRYHAQSNCCTSCGPSVFFVDNEGAPTSKHPFEEAGRLIDAGKIVAVKGTGGIHLACSATDKEAIMRLRALKKRPAQPLAIMARNIETVRKICDANDAEVKLLSSPARPIVLLRAWDKTWEHLSFGKRLGIMLPYTPLHYLLLDSVKASDIVVMTSANVRGCPVLTDNSEALNALSGIADGFLLHNRPIENRIDDSVALSLASSVEPDAKIYFFRRSRGYAPLPLFTNSNVSGIVAFGAEQKGSFALGRDNFAFPSPHIGDMKNAETFKHYTDSLNTYTRLFLPRREYLVCDMHPDYYSTRFAVEVAKNDKLPLLKVQHHWTHMASCMADNNIESKTFGIIWDGTGLGTDETIWGCEFLTGDFASFERMGSMRQIPLIGGDSATVDISRIAYALLFDSNLLQFYATYLPDMTPKQVQTYSAMINAGLNVPKASSMGRLFDGVSSLLGICGRPTFDGEAAQRLESLSKNEQPDGESVYSAPRYSMSFYVDEGIRRFDFRPMIREIITDLDNKLALGLIAEKFMLTLCHMALDQVIHLNPEKLPVVLSGGVFLNLYLLSGVRKLLTDAGYRVYTHSRISAGDEGICLGQLMIAAAKRNRNSPSQLR